jgi:acetylornithine deacetylase/succinyl-diaminopimelate desuccinylase-like protein
VTGAFDHLERHRDRHLAELAELLRFPSVSTLPRHSADLLECAEWLAARFAAIGLDGVELVETEGNPIVYGEWLHAESAPTALLYGHYDVQPAEPLELWTTPPFEATERGGRLYARGASDNKGPMYLNVAALEALLDADGGLPVNLRVVVEGEEELRADTLERFLRDDPRLGDVDIAVISDSAQYAEGVPGIPLGLRGMAALQFTVRTGPEDLHSGTYGGVAANATHVLGSLIASLHAEDGSIAVRGFYEDVRRPAEEELARWRELPFDDSGLGAARGGEVGFDHLERLWSRPTLDVHGVGGGFTDEGIKTVIPAVAHAKLSCRLVPDQEPERVLEQIVAHLRGHTPDGVELTIDWLLPGARPYLAPREHPAVRAARAALAEAYGREAVVFRCGWSVPVTELLARHRKIDSLLLGFAHPDERHHAPNEFFRISSFSTGARAMVLFWRRLASELPAAVALE